MTEEFIRPSSLSDFADCNKRAVASVFPSLVASKGYTLRTLIPGMASMVGTAFHSGAGVLLKGKSIEAAVARANNALLDEIAKAGGLHEEMFDKTTPDLATAKHQLGRMVASYRHIAVSLAAKDNVLALERMFRGTVGGVTVQGTPDIICTVSNTLIDLKTGHSKQHALQIGTYALLCEANGITIDCAEVHRVPRSPNKTQPPVTKEGVDLVTAKRHSENTIRRFHAVVSDFETKYDIAENFNSGLCQRRYCSAWGTDFCDLWKRLPAVPQVVETITHEETAA